MILSRCEFFPPSKSLNEKLRCFDCRVQQQLQQVFRDFNATCIDLRIGDNCLKMTGYIAIYKISFSITIFFVTMFFITLGVTTSKGIRACIHNGFWFIKVREEAMILIPILDMKISYIQVSFFFGLAPCHYACYCGNVCHPYLSFKSTP